MSLPSTHVDEQPGDDTAQTASSVPATIDQAPQTSRGRRTATAERRRPAEKETRITGQPGFVLHSYPYKETSLIVDVFTRDYGRIALVAKGAKRPHSKLRGVLQTFQPLSVGWTGKSEIRTLTEAEWIGGLLPLEKSALLCGFYLNELLVKLLARDDPHPALFDHYVSTLNQLAHDEPPPIVLRKFERALLKETGVGGRLSINALSGEPVSPDETYVVDPERGPRHALPADTFPRVSGKTLIDMEGEDYSDATTQLQSKFLMRFLLSHHLGGTPLNTRQILLDLMQL
ncbi:DNA repair protein RecO [Noviherbaspirillum sp. Root189]|uniref:DNA repair protein RecO n=1 Tax=Noviherbaspirillum sp. Root189 TaxID=1736487 RepID=UPI00070ECC87|nr:DNA repair protein RecO [Noviherbaspirillum sp. Root189]KRB70431.1 DNA repair protein RecO [Noviherbaspirillum sp. Root189]